MLRKVLYPVPHEFKTPVFKIFIRGVFLVNVGLIFKGIRYLVRTMHSTGNC